MLTPRKIRTIQLTFGFFILGTTNFSNAANFSLVCQTKMEVCRSKRSTDDTCTSTVSYPELTINVDTSTNWAEFSGDRGLEVSSMYKVVFTSAKIESDPSMASCQIGANEKSCSGFEINRATGNFKFFGSRNSRRVDTEINGQCEKVEAKF